MKFSKQCLLAFTGSHHPGRRHSATGGKGRPCTTAVTRGSERAWAVNIKKGKNGRYRVMSRLHMLSVIAYLNTKESILCALTCVFVVF